MANPLPLIIGAGAAILLLGGKKKKTNGSNDSGADASEMDATETGGDTGGGEPAADDTETDTSETDTSDEGMDMGEGLGSEGPSYGAVASGMRGDRRGQHAWRVSYQADGYHAEILVYNHRFSPVQEEVGVAASARGARKLLRDNFNELLLERYPDQEPKNDPPRRSRALRS